MLEQPLANSQQEIQALGLIYLLTIQVSLEAQALDENPISKTP